MADDQTQDNTTPDGDTLRDQVREALTGYGGMTETPAPGGVIFEWSGDPLIGVLDNEVVVRAEGGGWTPATGDLEGDLERASEVVIAECLVRWHEDLAKDRYTASNAMLALVKHEPDRTALQHVLLTLTHHPELRYLAVVCLGHVGRLDGEVLPEVMHRLKELENDPELSGTVENALGDIARFATNPTTSGTPTDQVASPA